MKECTDYIVCIAWILIVYLTFIHWELFAICSHLKEIKKILKQMKEGDK